MFFLTKPFHSTFQGDKLGRRNTLTTKLKSSNLQERERWGKQVDINECWGVVCSCFFVEMPVGKDGGHRMERCKDKKNKN